MSRAILRFSMYKKYVQLNLVHRYQIEAFNKNEMKQNFINYQIGVYPFFSIVKLGEKLNSLAEQLATMLLGISKIKLTIDNRIK